MSHDHKNGFGHHHDSCCSHSHHQEECCQNEESCDTHSTCCDHEHAHDHEDFYAELLELADQAWMEELKCKIKEQIRHNSGDQIEQLAKIVSDANHCRWKHKMAGKRSIGNFKSKVRDFFNHGR